VLARRHHPDAKPEVGARLASRPLIDVDLHMHTDHSHDCATSVETLLATARAEGLGAIAVTDHNEVSGALAARELADGLFIEERIPRGLTLQDTLAEIRRQGGLVYVPHPFDRMHSVPDYEHLLAVVEDIDAIEVFNPRIARMRDFDGPEEFLESLRDADIIGKPSSLYYAQVQALKFLQTKVAPPSGRRRKAAAERNR
jgi:predicted metal-dependent phosphoesterase TrpH